MFNFQCEVEIAPFLEHSYRNLPRDSAAILFIHHLQIQIYFMGFTFNSHDIS